jgi:hypothetical protein
MSNTMLSKEKKKGVGGCYHCIAKEDAVYSSKRKILSKNIFMPYLYQVGIFNELSSK